MKKSPYQHQHVPKLNQLNKPRCASSYGKKGIKTQPYVRVGKYWDFQNNSDLFE